MYSGLLFDRLQPILKLAISVGTHLESGSRRANDTNEFFVIGSLQVIQLLMHALNVPETQRYARDSLNSREKQSKEISHHSVHNLSCLHDKESALLTFVDTCVSSGIAGRISGVV